MFDSPKSNYLKGWKRALSIGKKKTDESPKASEQSLGKEEKKMEEETDTRIGGVSSHPISSNRGDKKLVVHNPRNDDAADKSGAKLVYFTSYGGKMTFPIHSKETLIGRKDDNDVVLTDAKISKTHCSIRKKDDGYYLTDLHSSNGVRLNNVFIEPGKPVLLLEGDCIMLGSIRLMFYIKTTASDVRTQIQNQEEDKLKLVQIMPSKREYDELIAVKAEIGAVEDTDFRRVDEVTNIGTLKEDYEKLRLAYELSKITLTNDITPHLEKSLELMFEILPVDRGVVLLVDQNTGTLATHFVKFRPGAYMEEKPIVLSSTILRKVYESRKCMFMADTAKDKELKHAISVNESGIRSIVCVPLIAHNKVHGILHLDSESTINNLNVKDLSVVTAISNQTAIAIENSILMSEYEANTRVTEQLSRFLAPQVVKKMTNRQEIIRKGGRMLVGTIIFVDIRGFTNFSENSEPVEIVHLLNDYFERLVKIVFKYNGVVDKYIGDALMAVFGTLEDETDSEFRAVAAAIEFKTAIKDMNEDRIRCGKEPISIGVGLNTGELLVGFIGSSQRLEYTCIGDSVNTSSRICSMAKEDQVLISEFTYAKVSDRIEAVQVGYRQFKGKAKEVMVYEVFSLKPGVEAPVTQNPQ